MKEVRVMFRFILGVVTGLLSSILFIFGGFFSFLGNQIYNVAENLGINKVYNDTKNTIDNKLNEYGIKEKVAKGVDYAKSAGGYLYITASAENQNFEKQFS